MYTQGDKVRRTTSREALDTQYDGSSRQHDKKIGSIIRVYEDLGEDVCDLEYADGTMETKVPVDELEPAKANIE